MNKIPKILHLYWDLSPMSYLQALTAVSFRKYNPSWEINVYVPKQGYVGNAKYIPDYIGEDYFHVVKAVSGINIVEVDLLEYSIDLQHHNILRSDILRYHLLYKHGGVWSDFDVLWLRPVEYFSEINYIGNVSPENITSVSSFIYGTHGGHSIGILIHTKEDLYAKSMIDLTYTVKPPFGHEVFGGNMLNRGYPTLESIQNKFPGAVGAIFETYYPYNIHPPKPTIQKLYRGVDLSPLDDTNVLCLHWYNGHVLSKQYVNNKGMSSECSMTTLLRDEGYI